MITHFLVVYAIDRFCFYIDSVFPLFLILDIRIRFNIRHSKRMVAKAVLNGSFARPFSIPNIPKPKL